MAIVGHGVDIVSNARIARMLAEHGDVFLSRCFTARERGYCDSHKQRVERYAARFAAKEAVVKALGTGLRGQMAWTDMEVLPDALGKPMLTLSGETARMAEAQGITSWHISLSHTRDDRTQTPPNEPSGHSIASVVAESLR